MRTLSKIMALGLVVGATSAEPSSSAGPSLIGTWRLVTYVDTPEGAQPVYAFGKQPVGQFIFTADHRAAISMMRNPPDPGKPTGDVDPDSCIPDWYCSYFGTYRLSADRTQWTIHVLGGNIPSFIGADQVRSFKIVGGRLLIYDTYIAEGKKVRAERILERVTSYRPMSAPHPDCVKTPECDRMLQRFGGSNGSLHLRCG
jgi:hypothetical protein